MWRRIAQVFTGVLLLSLIVYVMMWSSTSHSEPTPPPQAIETITPAPTTTTPDTSPSPEDTEASEPEPSPSSKPTERPMPPGGDKRGCPQASGAIDKTDPNCLKRTYRTYYVGNPAFECNRYDNRNSGLGPKTLNQFTPCVNSSFRVLTSSRDNKMTLYQSTSSTVELKSKKPDVANPRALGLDWIVWQEFQDNYFQLVTRHDGDLEYFGAYWRHPQKGWQRVNEFSTFRTGVAQEIVFFWDDPAKPPKDVVLPPRFSWSKVAKH